ncbi:hypothetical protein [Mycolicibacterium sp. 050158]|uniref:hypothetical protein n=1 Tax=Mycolicibacterium sp. 050158 TaxID=3090602 RepID=UPI00299E6BE5|nr:hypothetical protein [Mycolicibacterium sp. 050158]MDX1888708.1 hypothetical protein [Mycolicibacterium sp. 050158]
MDLTWIPVAIIGCVALALCIAAALLWPTDAERRRLRPLAHTERLTRLPEYIRAKRARTVATVVTVALLLAVFTGAVIAASRPTGLPTAARQSGSAQPEDIMLCVGTPPSDPAAAAVLGTFAQQVRAFGTERVGLTSKNRRVIPLTRDYQYAAQTLSDYARPAGGTDLPAFAPQVSYVDYAPTVEDLLALCLTGFPDFDQRTAQRRSVVYVGPGQLRRPGDLRPALFTADRVRELATTADVQLNALVTGPPSATLDALTAATGGRSVPVGVNATPNLAAIRDHPPASRVDAGASASAGSVDSPDVPLLVALLAAAVLALWPLVARR